MGISINLNGLENDFIPEVIKTKEELVSAKDFISVISIPSDFYYYSTLVNFPQQIESIRDKMNKIDLWINEIIKNFKGVESTNSSMLNEILGKILDISLTNSIGEKILENSEKLINNNTENQKLESDYNMSFTSIILDGTEAILNTGAEIVDAAKDGIEWIVNSINDGVNWLGDQVIDGAKWLLDTGAKIEEGVSNFYENYLKPSMDAVTAALEDVGTTIMDDFVLPVLASAGNFFVGIAEGFLTLGENLLDFGVTIGTDVACLFTSIYDAVTGEDVTSGLREAGMSFVAEEHVKSWFDDWYSEGPLSDMNNTAFGPFKRGGIGYNIAEGIGKTIGIGITGPFAPFVAGAAGFGQATEKIWKEKRDSSWEGIERLYENGEISEEQYESIKTIRELTDEEWKEVELSYKNGEISEEEYKAMKQIRDMPEEWATAENQIKGTIYGIGAGAWEGIQWFLGGKLNNWHSSTGSQLMTSVVRVGIDTGFNALDTPYRAALDSMINNKSYGEAFEDEGGWQSVLADVGIGLAGSVTGEIFDIRKAKRLNNVDKKVLDAIGYFEDLVKKGYLDESKLEKLIDKIIVTQSEAEFRDAFIRLGGSPEQVDYTLAFYSPREDKIYIKRDTDTQTIVHEMNHALGQMYKPESEPNTYSVPRGFNEAITEDLAIKLTNGTNNSGYLFNVEKINTIISILESQGYKDIEIQSYYGKKITNSKQLEEAINNIFDNSMAYEKLTNLMEFSDGCGYYENFTFDEIKNLIDESRKLITNMVDDLLEKLNIKGGENGK